MSLKPLAKMQEVDPHNRVIPAKQEAEQEAHKQEIKLGGGMYLRTIGINDQAKKEFQQRVSKLGVSPSGPKKGGNSNYMMLQEKK